jgi:hypothetical protein
MGLLACASRQAKRGKRSVRNARTKRQHVLGEKLEPGHTGGFCFGVWDLTLGTDHLEAEHGASLTRHGNVEAKRTVGNVELHGVPVLDDVPAGDGGVIAAAPIHPGAPEVPYHPAMLFELLPDLLLQKALRGQVRSALAKARQQCVSKVREVRSLLTQPDEHQALPALQTAVRSMSWCGQGGHHVALLVKSIGRLELAHYAPSKAISMMSMGSSLGGDSTKTRSCLARVSATNCTQASPRTASLVLA